MFLVWLMTGTFYTGECLHPLVVGAAGRVVVSTCTKRVQQNLPPAFPLQTELNAVWENGVSRDKC